MPLIQSASKKALKKNIETEMKSNLSPKDKAQNLAIAYSVQRRNKKKMASGGKAEPTPPPATTTASNDNSQATWQDPRSAEAQGMSSIRQAFASKAHGGMLKKRMAQGGPVSANDEEMDTVDESQSSHDEMMEDRAPRHRMPTANEESMTNVDSDDYEDRDMLRMSKGGMAPKMSIAMAIMKKKAMFDGGPVTDAEGMDLNADDSDVINMAGHNMPLRNHINAFSSRAGMDEYHSEDEMMNDADHSMDTAQDGDDLSDENKNSMASIIRARRGRK